MEIPIIYFSSSNNTKYIAELITRGLKLANHNPQLIPWTSFKSGAIDLIKYDVFGLGSPIYALSYPPFVISLLKELPKAENEQKFFLFDTNAGLPGNTLKVAKNILEKKGYSFLGALEIISPTRDSVFQTEFFDYVSWSEKKLHKSLQFGMEIGFSLRKPNPSVLDWTIKKMPFANLIRKGFQYLEGFFYKFIGKSIVIQSSKCTNCKVCLRVCPTSAITIDNGPIIHKELCTGCFKCLRECPEGALYLKQFPNFEYFEGPQTINGYISPDNLLEQYRKKVGRNR